MLSELYKEMEEDLSTFSKSEMEEFKNIQKDFIDADQLIKIIQGLELGKEEIANLINQTDNFICGMYEMSYFENERMFKKGFKVAMNLVLECREDKYKEK